MILTDVEIIPASDLRAVRCLKIYPALNLGAIQCSLVSEPALVVVVL